MIGAGRPARRSIQRAALIVSILTSHLMLVACATLHDFEAVPDGQYGTTVEALEEGDRVVYRDGRYELGKNLGEGRVGRVFLVAPENEWVIKIPRATAERYRAHQEAGGELGQKDYAASLLARDVKSWRAGIASLPLASAELGQVHPDYLYYLKEFISGELGEKWTQRLRAQQDLAEGDSARLRGLASYFQGALDAGRIVKDLHASNLIWSASREEWVAIDASGVSKLDTDASLRWEIDQLLALRWFAGTHARRFEERVLEDLGPQQRPAPGRIALSFSGLGGRASDRFARRERLEAVLDALEAHGISQSVFFVAADELDERSEQLLALLEARGQAIANGGGGRGARYRKSSAAVIDGVERAHAALSGRPHYRRWVRYPGLSLGSTAERVQELSAQRSRLALEPAGVTMHCADDALDGVIRQAERDRARGIPDEVVRSIFVDSLEICVAYWQRLGAAVGEPLIHVLDLSLRDTTAVALDALLGRLEELGWSFADTDTAQAQSLFRRSPKRLPGEQLVLRQWLRDHDQPLVSRDNDFLASTLRRRMVWLGRDLVTSRHRDD